MILSETEFQALLNVIQVIALAWIGAKVRSNGAKVDKALNGDATNGKEGSSGD